jgi:hypothetical protein
VVCESIRMSVRGETNVMLNTFERYKEHVRNARTCSELLIRNAFTGCVQNACNLRLRPPGIVFSFFDRWGKYIYSIKKRWILLMRKVIGKFRLDKLIKVYTDYFVYKFSVWILSIRGSHTVQFRGFDCNFAPTDIWSWNYSWKSFYQELNENIF